MSSVPVKESPATSFPSTGPLQDKPSAPGQGEAQKQPAMPSK
jgi:hypothetical protein